MYFGLLFLFLLYFFISWRHYFPYFKSNSSNLDNIAFHECMTFDLLPSIVAVLYNLPKHPLRIFKEVIFLNVIESISNNISSLTFHVLYFGIFGHLKCCVSSTIAILVIYPPMATNGVSTLSNLSDKIRF